MTRYYERQVKTHRDIPRACAAAGLCDWEMNRQGWRLVTINDKCPAHGTRPPCETCRGRGTVRRRVRPGGHQPRERVCPECLGMTEGMR